MTLGHNSGDGDRLRSFIERIERMDVEIDELKDLRKDIFTEAKSAGFDVSILREVLKIRKQDKSKREEREELISVYLHALGDLKDTPLGAAAVGREFA